MARPRLIPKAAPTKLQIHKALFTTSPVRGAVSSVPAENTSFPSPATVKLGGGTGSWVAGPHARPGVPALTFSTAGRPGPLRARRGRLPPLSEQTAAPPGSYWFVQGRCMRDFSRLPGCGHCPAEALRQAPGMPIVLLRPEPVKVRSDQVNALAYTVTDVLVEWDVDGGYHLRWEASWLIRRSGR